MSDGSATNMMSRMKADGGTFSVKSAYEMQMGRLQVGKWEGWELI